MTTQTTGRVVPPGPKPMPVLGWRGTKLQFNHDPVAYHTMLYNTYGSIAALNWRGNRVKVYIYDPEYYHQVMSQPDLFYSDRTLIPGPPDSALQRLGTGLTAMNGDLHKQQRRLILPAFHRQSVAGYRDTMVAITQSVIEKWQPGTSYDMAAEMHELTLRIASQTLFGIDTSNTAESLRALYAHWVPELASPGVWLFPVDLPGTPYRRVLKRSEEMERHIQSLITYKRAHPEEQNDILTMLINARDEDGTRMTDADLIGQVTLLFLAGFDTTTLALTWTLFLLAQHPKILGDLLDELDGMLHGDPPSIGQLDKLPLLEAVVKESLRLFPPGIHGGRIGMAPFAFGPYEFPAGTKIMYSQYITHRIPEIYSEPQRFLPSRWQTISPGPYEYVPFLAGARMCIGATFAMMELKIVLAMIVQRFRLALQPNAVVDRMVRFVLLPRNGMPMTVHSQDRQFTKTTVRGNVHEMVDLGSAS